MEPRSTCVMITMHSIFEQVISNYNERCVEPLADRDTSGNETPESLKTRFKCYDKLECYDRGFSQLAVESCVSVTLKEKIVNPIFIAPPIGHPSFPVQAK